MNVISMLYEILIIANPVVGESALPDFAFAAQDLTECMRVAAFDQLNRMLERYAQGGSEE